MHLLFSGKPLGSCIWLAEVKIQALDDWQQCQNSLRNKGQTFYSSLTGNFGEFMSLKRLGFNQSPLSLLPSPHYVSLLHLCIIHHLNHWYSLFFIKVFHDFYQLPFCAALMNSPCCVTFSAPFFSPFLLLSLSSLFFLCCFQPVKIFTLSRSTHAVRDLFFYNFFFYIALSRLSYQHCLQRQESK